MAHASSNAIDASRLSRVVSDASRGNALLESLAFIVSRKLPCVPTRNASASSPGRLKIAIGVSASTPSQQSQVAGFCFDFCMTLSTAHHRKSDLPVLRRVSIVVQPGNFQWPNLENSIHELTAG